MAKNLMGKRRETTNPYEIWKGKAGTAYAGWEWRILKKSQADDTKPFGRAFCHVTTPTNATGDFGDVYIAEIHRQATRTFIDPTIEEALKTA